MRTASLVVNPSLRFLVESPGDSTQNKIANFNNSYERILGRLEQSLGPKQQEIAHKLFGWMVCAKRPLKWQEIQAAISIDANGETIDFDRRGLKSSVEDCGPLIQVLSGDRVEFMHNTAKL